MKIFNFHILTDKTYQDLLGEIDRLTKRNHDLNSRNLEVVEQANTTYYNYERQCKFNAQLKETIENLESQNRNLLAQLNRYRKKFNKKPL